MHTVQRKSHRLPLLLPQYAVCVWYIIRRVFVLGVWFSVWV